MRLICRTPTRVDSTGRPVPTTGPILYTDLIIGRRTITWAEMSAQKTKLPSHKVNSANSICFSLTCVCVFVCSLALPSIFTFKSSQSRFTCMSYCETYRVAVVRTTGAYCNHEDILSYYCFVLNDVWYENCLFCICLLEYYLENNELYRNVHN